MKEMVGGCCVCSDERGWPDNPLVYCDGNGCTVAVHQACYGIVTVPTGPWFCRKCESQEVKGKVKCELCPSKAGALKRSDTGGWAHVVCALYIPEVRFGNVTSMEPIVLRLIPPERFNKTCYICQDMGKTHRATAGACMQCNKTGCKQQFHVTCAQALGLLCEEAGNYLDNVKYCGYCQHHYSKLKKGGNVKTIPPYKPVSHDSQSSDSSCEKEGGSSPMPSGSGTPTHTTKSKGPGRKTSHTSTMVPGKSTPNPAKTPTNTPQPMDKKKQSPARRGSSTGDGGCSSKSSTPAPSPHHSSETAQPQGGKAAPPPAGGSTPAAPTPKVAPPAASPSATKPVEPVGVISSVASATATTAPTTAPTTATVPTSAAISTSVVQMVASKPTYQESVITNTEAIDTKQTKKRKAVTAANNQNTPVDYAAIPAPAAPMETSSHGAGAWDAHVQSDAQMESIDKHIKKPKTDVPENFAVAQHYASASQVLPPPPPPPAHSPASHPSPRHLPSPKPGPSGLNMRSPSHHQGGKAGRDDPATSLLVSVPLPSTSQGLNLSTHSQGAGASEMPVPTQHIFHLPQKQAAMEPSMPAHSSHSVPGRSWGGLNVAYEIQQDPNKPGVSGMGGAGKEMGQPTMGPITIRTTKKRAAMASAAGGMNNMSPNIQTVTTQSLAAVRRQPHPTPAPIYQETIKDSPPSSPSSDRPLRSKMETKMSASCTAPHMLGNELNPESGAAASLQEQLTAELAAHAAGGSSMDPMIPPPLINKAAPAAALSFLARQMWAPYWSYGYGMMPTNFVDATMRTRGYSPCGIDNYSILSQLQTNKIAPGASGGSGRGSSAQSLDQLLERQWEQGSQFLMEQAQHFDIASLLSCLHQLRTENVRLEEHVGNLLQRRDHLLAVNARLAIPLTTEMDQSKAYNASGVPCTITGPPEQSRARENGGQQRQQRAPETITSERSHQVMMEQLIMREMQQKPS